MAEETQAFTFIFVKDSDDGMQVFMPEVGHWISWEEFLELYEIAPNGSSDMH